VPSDDWTCFVPGQSIPFAPCKRVCQIRNYKLTDVIAAHKVQLVGYGIDAKTYRSLAPNKKQNEFLANKYAAPFGGAVELACKAMGNVPGPDEVWKVLEEGETWAQCDFFIESNEYSASAQRTIESMRNAKDLWFRSRIGKDSYGEKSGPKGVSLLQVADLGAFRFPSGPEWGRGRVRVNSQ
jgi:hypothetical protein